jgi:hypothetical protein
MLLFLVKAFSLVIWNWTGVGLLGDGHDRDGPLRQEGRLLLGHVVSGVRGIRSGRRIG